MKSKSVDFKNGIFTLSLDTELAWGVVDKPKTLYKNRAYYENTRSVIKSILDLLQAYEISATWALVGHLFLDEYNIRKGVKGCQMSYSENSSYRLGQKSIWYGRDITKDILNSKIPHEIGSHSFYHIIFGDRSTKRDLIQDDLESCILEAEKMGIELKSFVFPRNNVAYLDELSNFGFTSFRGLEPSWYINYPKKLKKVCHIIDQFFAISPPVTRPYYKKNIINIPASMFYMPANGFRKYIPIRSRIIKAKKGIEKAIQEKKVFHLWFHPFNIATNPERLLCGLEAIFKEVSEERKKGSLEVMTMGQIANVVNKKEDVQNEG